MIERFTAQMDFDAFREDPKTIAAVERRLQIISEAAIRLGAVAENKVPALNGARFGVSETGYGISMSGIELPVIFKTIKDDLPLLKAAVLGALLPSSVSPKDPFPG
jgi:uncharacterized protein with HEPN domain